MRWSLLVVFLLACAPAALLPTPATPRPPPPAARTMLPLPLNMAVMHVDLAFSLEERTHIRNAASAWFLLSRGRAKLVIAEDLDFGALTLEDTHRIVKMDSKNNPLLDSVDAKHNGAVVLAFTLVPTKNPWGTRQIYMVVDRVRPDNFMWVVAHEMGHVLGLDDLEAPGSVMSGLGRFTDDWFTAEDVKECQAALVCL